MNVLRIDTADIGKTYRTPEGFIKTDAIITRTGVFKYRNMDGTIRRELRHPNEVFRTDSLNSLKMIPLVNGHPKERLVTPETAKELQCGFTGENVRRDGNSVRIPITITTKDAIEAVEHQGRNKLSLGYAVELVNDSGVYEGEEYDCVQTNIIGNHLALVNIARAGDTAQIHLDSADAILMEENNPPINSKKEAAMPKVNLDGIEYEAAPEVINALGKATKALTDAQVKLDGVVATTDKLTANVDTLKAENETLKARNLDGEIKAGVQARLDLERKASICLDGEDLSSSSDTDIKAKVIAKQFPEIKLDGKSSDYVNACFDNAVVLIAGKDEGAAMRDQRKQSGSNGFNADGDDVVDAARQKMVSRLTSGYRGTKE